MTYDPPTDYDPEAEARRLDMLRKMHVMAFGEEAPEDLDADAIGELVYEEIRRRLAGLLRDLDVHGMGEAKKDPLWQLGFAVTDRDPDPLRILICVDQLIRDSLKIAEREGKIILVPPVEE